MFAIFPDLSPRDSHSLWYTSSRNPYLSSNGHDANHLNGLPHEHGHGHGHQQQASHRRGTHLIERSPLARLRADEQNLERRRQNVTNFGSTWLKPPGLPKTLHQLREERREAEEHQEALRREQLAQELAEAEAEAAEAAAAAAAGAPGVGGNTGGNAGGMDAMLDALPGGDDGMDDVQLDGAHDLDDDIPEADAADFGLSGAEEDEDEDDEDEEEEDDDDDDEDEDDNTEVRTQQQQLIAQHMRQGNDAFRENMARGRDDAAFYGRDEDIDDEDQSQMLEEEDLVGGHEEGMDGDDMGMDADLDDDIPEAESLGGYEHTDTEAELESSVVDHGHHDDDDGDDEDDEDDDDDEDVDHSHISFALPHPHQRQNQHPRQQHGNRLRHSFARSDATRNSLAISDILSRDGSSFLDSSPVMARQRPGPSARRGRH